MLIRGWMDSRLVIQGLHSTSNKLLDEVPAMELQAMRVAFMRFVPNDLLKLCLNVSKRARPQWELQEPCDLENAKPFVQLGNSPCILSPHPGVTDVSSMQQAAGVGRVRPG